MGATPKAIPSLRGVGAVIRTMPSHRLAANTRSQWLQVVLTPHARFQETSRTLLSLTLSSLSCPLST